MKIYRWITLVTLLALTSAPVLAALPNAGTITDARGTVRATNPDRPPRVLRKGDSIYPKDRITTAKRSRVRMRFTDGSRFALGQKARMRVEKYSRGGAGKRPSFSTRILRGAFRFFSGLIAKKNPRAMSVGLSVATIGIRGTQVGGEVTETSATVILLEPEEDRPTSVEVFNEFGSVTIDEPGFGTDIPDEHSPPSPVRRMKMRTINNLMRSMQSIQRLSRPRVGVRR